MFILASIALCKGARKLIAEYGFKGVTSGFKTDKKPVVHSRGTTSLELGIGW